jgi:hypothetical protein
MSLYLRASAVFRLARFPYIGMPFKEQVFGEQEAVYLRGARLWTVPIRDHYPPQPGL